jgi:hypothetical protein
MRHLKDNDMSYTQHWRRSMKLSIALFIHAWIPKFFETYASDELSK